MAESPQTRIKYLRQIAEHSRVLARGPISFAVAREIEAFADDLEADARKIEQSMRSAGHKAIPQRHSSAATGPHRKLHAKA